jgi:hypothetical protein
MYTATVLGAEATRNVLARCKAITNHVAAFVQTQRERLAARLYTFSLARDVVRGAAEPFSYSITSSARARSVAGTSRPRAFAVLRLISSSYRVGACTGRSAGFSPRRTRST